MVTFRSELGDLDLLDCDASLTTGSDAACAADEIVAGDSDSLTGNTPTVHTEEKVAGLPSYQGMYTPAATGDYDVVVRQLTQGGLSAEYFDNQWLQGDPTVERIDAAINFDWGTGALTPYGRDYVSARWSGKLKASYNEIYTIFCRADDGVRLYVDHELVVDAWENASVTNGGQRVDLRLSAGGYHDIVVEYKEVTGAASVSLYWSSYSTTYAPIPSGAAPDDIFDATSIP